ncbi:MAG: RIP metalloprotease RseP [Gammaproteobacteria bacterium]
MLVIALLSFAAVILPVVAIHEFGHYAAARFFGVRVLRFSVGFGKPLALKTDSAGTEWALAPILLGGYVRLLDAETAAKLNAPHAETMEAQNNWRRFVIYAAGPLANIILAIVILTGVFMSGETGLAPRIGAVHESSPAARAGLAAGDEILRINGAETPLWRRAVLALADAALEGEDIALETDGGAHNIAADALSPADVRAGLLPALGLFPDDSYITQTVEIVVDNSAAQKAGILSGDAIAAVDDVVPNSWRETADAILARPGKRVSLILWRDGEPHETEAVLSSEETNGRQVGRLGVVPRIDREKLSQLLVTVQLAPIPAFAAAGRKTFGDLLRTFQFLGHILGGNLSFQDNISGPVGIARGAGAAAAAGWTAWWGFAALISVSLAAVNLLPLPVLDGGQMAICAAQAALRRPLPQKLLAGIERAGVLLILLLMIAAIAADLSNLP